MTMRGLRRGCLLAMCVGLAVAGLLSACAGPPTTSRTTDPTPSWASPSVSPYTTGKKANISYGPNSDQVMDICYQPTPSQTTGAFLLIHGGSW